MFKRGLILSCLVWVLLGVSLLSGWGKKAPVAAQVLATSTVPAGEAPLQAVWVVRAYFSEPQMVNEVASRKEPWEVRYDQGYLVVDVTLDEATWLEMLGFRLEVDAGLTDKYNTPRTRAPGQVSGIPGFACYRTVEETFASALAIVTQFPQLAAWIDIGDTWNRTQNPNAGYDLNVLNLTNQAVSGEKPILFVMSGLHAREYAPPELSIRFAEYLVNRYGKDPDVTWLLDNQEIRLLLHSNPDGRKQAEIGLPWRKNVNNNFCSFTAYRGVDLNRNFSFLWNCCGGSSSDTCSDIYHGPSPASEPETQAVQNYLRSIFPDQRADSLTSPAPASTPGLFLDIHSFGELLLWPWGFTTTPPPNGTALQTLGRKMAYFNGYTPGQATILYKTDGTSDDFAYGDLGVAGFTYELGTYFFQDCWSFENQILPDNLESLLYAAKASRAPYLLPSGPDVLDVQISPAGVAPGGLVQIIAQVDDTRFNTLGGQEPTQKITASEMYIDIPPWSLGAVPLGMSPADGGYDQNMETSTYSLDTSGLSTGRHTVYVRGQDADGHWGVVTGAFLYILDAESASTIEGYLRDAGTGLPLAGTVTANDIFSVESNPLTGFYQVKSIGGVYDVSASVPGYGQGTANMNVQPGASIQQDFNLYPVCTIFSDNVENGDAGWEEDPSWGIVDFYTHSTGHAWAESPSGSYQNNQDSSLRSPVFDLSQYQNITLSFWQVCNTETGWDLCQVETSRDGGTNWEVIAAFSGEGTSWRKVEVPLSNLAGEPNARFRFRFTSDGSNTADGWRLDDFKLEGSGPLCMPPLSNAQAYHQKSTSQTTVDAGSVLTYTLSYQADLSGSHTYALAITDILPDALEVMTGTIYLEDNSNLAGSFHPELYQPGENILKVESAGIFTDSYQVTVTYQSRVNSAAVVDSQITGIVQTSSMVDGALVVLPPAAADPVTVTASADLVLTMTPASSFTFLGQIALFKIEILNQGPSDAQSLLITDTLPVSLTLSAAPMCEIDSQKGLVTCQAASLSAGQKIDFEVYARASVTGTVTNQAAVSTTTRDPDLSNNISASDVQVLFPAYRFWLPFVQRQPPK